MNLLDVDKLEMSDFNKYTPTETLLSQILREIEKSNKLKERELRQQLLFIELFEECLSIDDVKKRGCHQRAARSSLNDW